MRHTFDCRIGTKGKNMAWLCVVSGAATGFLIAILAYAAGWPFWLVLLLYPAAGAGMTGIVLLALLALDAFRHGFAGAERGEHKGSGPNALQAPAPAGRHTV